jgi:hypothetical protein
VSSAKRKRRGKSERQAKKIRLLTEELKANTSLLDKFAVANSATAHAVSLQAELQKDLLAKKVSFSSVLPIDNLGDYTQKAVPSLTQSSVVNQQVDELNDNPEFDSELQEKEELGFEEDQPLSFRQGTDTPYSPLRQGTDTPYSPDFCITESPPCSPEVSFLQHQPPRVIAPSQSPPYTPNSPYDPPSSSLQQTHTVPQSRYPLFNNNRRYDSYRPNPRRNRTQPRLTRRE